MYTSFPEVFLRSPKKKNLLESQIHFYERLKLDIGYTRKPINHHGTIFLFCCYSKTINHSYLKLSSDVYIIIFYR